MAAYLNNPDIPVKEIPNPIPDDPQYYKTHRFLIEDPKEGITWLKAIQRQNAANIVAVRLYVPASYNWLDFETCLAGPGWCTLVEWLVLWTPGLKDVKIFWDCDTREWEVGRLGGGSDPDMLFAVKELKGLKELERLEFGGFYDDTWVKALWDQLDMEASTVEEALDAKEDLSSLERIYLENLAIFREKM